MIKYTENKFYTLYQGEMQEVIDKEIQENSIDSIVTDPPYELNFMGKGWDNSGVAFRPDTWKRCFKVLKPGGYLLAFGGSRTFHRIACAIEDAGFEIRDTIMWLYGSGFPKSMNIGLAIDKKNGVDNRTGNIVKGMGSNNTTAMKNCLSESQEFASEYEERIAQNEWNGWGTCLKPAYEPIIVARKPFKGSCIENVMEYGVGGINIDECRVGFEERKNSQAGFIRIGRTDEEVFFGTDKNRPKDDLTVIGRFPANVILTYDDTDFDEVCGGFPNTKSNGGEVSMPKMNSQSDGINLYNFGKKNAERIKSDYVAPYDEGSAARYFYCAKASKKDRDEGLNEFEEKKVYGDDLQWGYDNNNGDNFGERISNVTRKNIHPTVKPTELMQYLIRLVTPKGGTILDPFNGSGSTGKAAMFENVEKDKGYKYIGIELTEEYLPISKARIDYALSLKNSFREELKKTTNNNDSEQKENKEENAIQLTIFDF